MINNSMLPTDTATPAPEHVEKPKLRSTLVSRNVTIGGKRTSIRLEPEMWDGLREICRRERANMHQICTSVSIQKTEQTSLTAAIRVYVMRYYRAASTEDGHTKAGHGFGLTLAIGINQRQHYTPRPTAVLNKTSFS